MAAILTVQGGIIMQNRQIDGHGLYLSLLAGLAVLCLAAALVWFARPQPETAAPRYLLKDSGGHVALYTADGIGPLATYDDLYTRLRRCVYGRGVVLIVYGRKHQSVRPGGDRLRRFRGLPPP